LKKETKEAIKKEILSFAEKMSERKVEFSLEDRRLEEGFPVSRPFLFR